MSSPIKPEQIRLPESVSPQLLVEVTNQTMKETRQKLSVEHLLKFIDIIKDQPEREKPQDKSDLLEFKLRQSQNEVLSLNKALSDCQSQIKNFHDVVLESLNVMKEINNKWAAEKQEADVLREKLKVPNDEIIILKKALLDSERQLDSEKRKKSSEKLSQFDQTIQTEDKYEKYTEKYSEKYINELLEQNQQLKIQMKQNLETFDKLAESVQLSKKLEKTIIEKENEIQAMKKDKQELVEAVELLVASAQKIMESGKGSKQQKLRMFAEIMGSMKSISLSDLQR